MNWSLSYETYSCLGNKVIPHLLKKPKVYCSVCKRPPPAPVLYQINPVYTHYRSCP